MFDVQGARARLASSADAVAALVADVDDDEARFHPRSGAWSILEILGHLGLEEIDDFRARFASTVRDPAAPWPPIDPEAAVRDGSFDERPRGELVEAFLRARRESLAYLGGLDDVDLGVAYRHPRGPITAGDLLASWVAHDLFHERQIVKNRYAYLQGLAAPHGVAYAGTW